MYNQIGLGSLEYFEKLSFFARISSDYINMEAIFSDETGGYVAPECPNFGDNVAIKIRVGKNNVDEVYLCHSESKILMSKIDCIDQNELFDIYQTTLINIEENYGYYFLIIKNNRKYYYNKRGLNGDINESYNFLITPGFDTPKWAKGAVMYQIYVDRFYNGDTTNDVVFNEYAYLGQAAKPILNWNQTPEKLDVANFYGGDLQGVMDKIPYLKDLGVEVIYFCPIFVSPSNHKYDIQDYDHIDPHLGVIAEDGGEALYFEKFHNKYATKYIQRTTKKANLEASDKLFADLVALAHENGIKVILDGVFNHCGAFNKWMDKQNFYSGKGYENGAYLDENSPYHNYFRWYDKNWPNNDCYDSWWGFENHPKLNYEASPELYEYIMNIGKKWVSPPYNVDGWRFDVAADLGYSKEFNHKFWRDFRKAVKEANPNAIILAEHYGDPKDWLCGDQWDTIMNYDAFMEPITWFLTGMEKHSEEFKQDMLCNAMAFENNIRYQMSRFSAQSLYISMNMLSNHDHSRFLTRTNMQVGRLHTKGSKAAGMGINKSIMMEAVTFQMTWPGAPTLYYGDEVSVTGWTDPDNRRTYPWGKEDEVMLNFHKTAITMHKKYNVLKHGSLEFLYSNYGILCYARFDSEQKMVIVLNNNREEKTIEIPVWRAQIKKDAVLERILQTANESFSVDTAVFKVANGFLEVIVPAFSSSVYIEK